MVGNSKKKGDEPNEEGDECDKQKEMNGVEPTNDNGEFIQRLQ
jgi:hypothetical protein